MNSYNATGRLTRDPDSGTTRGGTSVCKMRVAFETRDPDKPAFLAVDCYGKQADACNEHLNKGSRIAVSGLIETPQWESNGQPRSMVVVVARSVDFLSPKPDGEQPAGSEEPSEPAGDIPAADPSEMAAIAAGNGSDDDIAF